MHRTARLLALALGTLTAAPLASQDMMGRRASQFDLGIYAGGAYMTDWFDTPDAEGDVGWGPGLGSIFGATGTYWVSPTFGIRLHGAYNPSTLPESDGVEFDNLDVNNYTYDLDLVYRPWLHAHAGDWMGSTYVFLGAGGHTTNVAGSDGCVAVPVWVITGVCVPRDGGWGSTGQVALGAGADFSQLRENVGVFTELGVHIFDSPAHVYADVAKDRMVIMPRLVVGLKWSPQ